MRYVEKLATDPLVIEAQGILENVNHYNDSDRVKDIIRILYSGCCAFCGSYPEHSSFYQIEHFYPKGIAVYSHYVKDIFNLHYGCQRCNTLKSTPVHLNIFSPNTYLRGNKWNHSTAKKIETELVYIGHILYPMNNRAGSIDRAKETIKLFDLNNDNGAGRSGRQHLVEERIRIFDSVFQILNTIYHLIKEEQSGTYINQSIKFLFRIVVRYLDPQSPYSNMIAQNFGDDIFKLLSIFLQKRLLLKNKQK
ncbi:hypothetical protein F0L74_25855 [Chitinophaga agrisoli]|uniref:HNH endonuclease n=1 Tax=Chitinophaga agrisoli TaxID=2607653 RepID=A0A5B2VLU7_9BACT|nr:hypothetical protein [Chitinophaga agrisoli]KAA2239620.1 hypothetical protein F0L74_25855 [Chitinophaga agrisoli]